jgi:citrate synthase
MPTAVPSKPPRTPKPIRSDIAYSTPDKIVVRGKDLCTEILGHYNLGDMAFLQITGREPTPAQSKVFNACVVTLVDHGMTPSSIAARMTYAGAPEALQAAVAAGLCGLGTVFVGSMEGAARMLQEALGATPNHSAIDLDTLAHDTVAAYAARKQIVPGFGHPVHKPIDPRAPRLFEIAAENDLAGNYVALMQKIGAEAAKQSGKVLPINATGAIGAIACELGFPWKIVRGLGVIGRAIGLVGHILEESHTPMGVEIWHRVEEEAAAHQRAG